MLRRGGRENVEVLGNRSLKLRVIAVDGGIDDGHKDVLAFGDRMRFGQTQLGDPILRGIAFPFRIVLLKRVQVIGLSGCDDPIGLKFANHGAHRTAIGNAPAVKCRAGQRKGLTFKACQAVPPLQRIDLLVAH